MVAYLSNHNMCNEHDSDLTRALIRVSPHTIRWTCTSLAKTYPPKSAVAVLRINSCNVTLYVTHFVYLWQPSFSKQTALTGSVCKEGVFSVR